MKTEYLDREALALLKKIAENAMKTKLIVEETKYGIVFRPVQENKDELVFDNEDRNILYMRNF